MILYIKSYKKCRDMRGRYKVDIFLYLKPAIKD